MPLRDQLLDILMDLEKDDLKKFQWYLKDKVLDGFPPIPKSKLEGADRLDTVSTMLEVYNENGALMITFAVLKKMENNRLVKRLQDAVGGEAESTPSVAAKGTSDISSHNGNGSLAAASASAPDDMYPQRDPKAGPVTQLYVPRQPSNSAGIYNRRPEFIRDACELTLDTNTAHRNLYLGSREVTHVSKAQPYPDHQDRFDKWEQVLCREQLVNRRCYWEVEWSGSVGIAVTYRGICRKGGVEDCALGENDKSWSLVCNDCYTAWHDSQDTDLSVPISGSNRVGVYLDWPSGTLSFYRISSDAPTLLHTFRSGFTEPLYPGFQFGDFGSTVSLCQVK